MKLWSHTGEENSATVGLAVLMIWFTSSMDTRSLPDFLFTLYDHDHDGLMHKVRLQTFVLQLPPPSNTCGACLGCRRKSAKWSKKCTATCMKLTHTFEPSPARLRRDRKSNSTLVSCCSFQPLIPKGMLGILCSHTAVDSQMNSKLWSWSMQFCCFRRFVSSNNFAVKCLVSNPLVSLG